MYARVSAKVRLAGVSRLAALRRHFVNLSGIGSMWLDGEQIQPALKYAVSVTQHRITTRATGHIRIEHHAARKLISRLGPNNDLVLVLEDGRRWPCTLKNSDGDLMGRGEIR